MRDIYKSLKYLMSLLLGIGEHAILIQTGSLKMTQLFTKKYCFFNAQKMIVIMLICMIVSMAG